ncbi:hypothetical protein GR138_05590 [Shinella kummerowiae]|uniref:Uncharacterized protein n=1 Tax=Shinella kummerowiae TaxID=417745 RepID=A0A6N8SCE3_9HYPH|nr:hypothetical protein [Shinella kummerowiae]MXN44652.1 hypothetical protein [Shinella kummerowiae]
MAPKKCQHFFLENRLADVLGLGYLPARRSPSNAVELYNDFAISNHMNTFLKDAGGFQPCDGVFFNGESRRSRRQPPIRFSKKSENEFVLGDVTPDPLKVIVSRFADVAIVIS